MTPALLPPSAEDWVTEQAINLLEGRRLLIRALPRTGKSWFADHLVGSLGATALLVRGREFTEQNQADLRGKLVAQLKALVAERGSAQLVFDDYHRALARSQGARLQAQLYAVLVDSPEARDIGAVFLARQLTSVHLDVRGSPLASRLEPAALPEWDERDMRHFGIDDPLDELVASIGSALVDLHRFRAVGYERVVERLRIDADSIVKDLPSDATEALVGAQELDSLSSATRRQMVGLVHSVGASLQVTNAVKDSDLKAHVRQSAGWPSDLRASAAAFAELLNGCDHALWSDRYLSVDPQRLTTFLLAVRESTNCRIDLLMSERVDGLVSFADLGQVEERCSRVSVKLMTHSDRRLLHERHLVRLGEGGGWAIPIFAALVGSQPVGSAVATRAAGFGVDYKAVWGRSIPLASRMRLAHGGV